MDKLTRVIRAIKKKHPNSNCSVCIDGEKNIVIGWHDPKTEKPGLEDLSKELLEVDQEFSQEKEKEKLNISLGELTKAVEVVLLSMVKDGIIKKTNIPNEFLKKIEKRNE